MKIPDYLDPALRTLLFLWMIIALGLLGRVISILEGGTYSSTSFGLFTAIFGLLFCAGYGIAAAYYEKIAIPMVTAIIDFVTMVFTFAAATSVAILPDDGCAEYLCAEYPVAFDITVTNCGWAPVCKQGQAAVAFLFLGFFTTLVLVVLSIRTVLQKKAYIWSWTSSHLSAAPAAIADEEQAKPEEEMEPHDEKQTAPEAQPEAQPEQPDKPEQLEQPGKSEKPEQPLAESQPSEQSPDTQVPPAV
jgi:hypothetical protein